VTTVPGDPLLLSERSAIPPTVGVGVGVAVGVGVGVGVGVFVRVGVFVGVAVIEGVGDGVTVHGNLYWKAPGEVVVQFVKAEVTVTSTAVPTLTNVPAGVLGGQAGAVAPLSGTVTTTAVGETVLIGAARPPKVTLVMLPRFAPLMVTTVPGGPEFGLIEVMMGLVITTW